MSFLISWALWNWFFLYYLFNFPSDWDAVERTNFINKYIQAHRWSNMLGWPMLTSFTFTLIYIFCSAVFLAVFTFYKVSIKAWIFDKMSKGLTVPKSLFTSVEKRLQTIEQSYDKLRHEHEEQGNDQERQLEEYRRIIALADTDREEKNRLSKEFNELTAKSELLMKNNRELKLFNEQSVQEFLRMFANDKSWHIIITGNSSRFPELRFGSDFSAIDVSNNRLLYQVGDIKFSEDSTIISFLLVRVTNTAEKHRFWVCQIERNFQGIYQQGGIVAPVLLTQQGKTLTL